MPRSFFLTLALALATVASVSCTIKHTHPVGQAYPPNPDPASIRLFTGILNAEHEEIAYIQTPSEDNKRVATRREMIADLQKRAAKVGADVIMDVQLLTEDHHGVTLNRATPIRTPRQGEYKRYFMRGVAIRLLEDLDENVGKPIAQTDEAMEAIPVVQPAPATEEPAPTRYAY
jgi:hypothetical protein